MHLVQLSLDFNGYTSQKAGKNLSGEVFFWGVGWVFLMNSNAFLPSLLESFSGNVECLHLEDAGLVVLWGWTLYKIMKQTNCVSSGHFFVSL